MSGAPGDQPARDERLEALLAEVGRDDQPPPGWQAQVWRRLEARAAPRSSRRPLFRRGWWWWLAPAGALTAAVLALLWLRPLPPAALGIEVVVAAGRGPLRRGEEARPGDRLRLSAQIGSAPHAELRIYRGEREMILSCSTQPPCRRRGERLEAELVLEKPGLYQPLVLVCERALPAPAAGLDADTAAALGEGAELVLGEAVAVR